MKFKCATQDLISGLINATRALNSRPAMQILEGVLLQTEENEILLTCTDGSLTIRTRVKATIEQNGSVILPGKLLTEIVRKLPDDIVSFSMNEKMLVTVRCAKSRSTIIGMVSDDFPAIKDLFSTHGLHLPQKRLKEMISKVTFAIAAAQESRQTLTGCLLEITKEELRLVGLDGFRLAMQILRDNFVLPDGSEGISAIIPGHAMNEMSRIMNDENSMVTFHLDKTHLMAVIDDTILVTTLLAGEYINYRQILPTAWSTRVTVKSKELQEAIDRTSLIAREGKNNLIKMEASNDNLQLSSMSETGDALEKMDIILEGEKIEIAFNARYISDVMKNVEDECCVLSMNTNVSPCVISPVNGDEYLYLVLPVRVHN